MTLINGTSRTGTSQYIMSLKASQVILKQKHQRNFECLFLNKRLNCICAKKLKLLTLPVIFFNLLSDSWRILAREQGSNFRTTTLKFLTFECL